MKRITTIALVAVAIIIGTILGSAFVSSFTPSEASVARPDASYSNSDRQRFEGGFMDGCTEETDEATCRCMFDELVDTYGYETVVRRSIDYVANGKDISDMILTVVPACV